jgi:hypothetical protein
MSNKNTYLDLADDNDFGFTFAHEEELLENNPSHSSLQEEVDDLKKRLVALNKIFMPLLENLSKDPDKPMIKWPNRKDIIDKQIQKLKTLTKV